MQSIKRRTALWKKFIERVMSPVIRACYRSKMTWLLGDRFVVISHIGRKSGKTRNTILFVHTFDRSSKAVTVISAFGVTDWYKNISAAPSPQVQIGQVVYKPRQRLLTGDEIVLLEQTFRRKFPVVARAQAWLMNWPWSCSAEQFEIFARSLCGVVFWPDYRDTEPRIQ